MARRLSDTRKRKRRQIWWRIFKWIFVLGAIAAFAAYGYQTGTMLAEQKVVVLKDEVRQLSNQVKELNVDIGKLATTVTAERQRVKEWESAYNRDAPTGELKNLYAQLQEKSNEGVSFERLAFVIAQAREQRNCDDKVVNKRFIVQTALYKGANDSVAFAGKSITVTAKGETAIGANGARNAWYDKTKPVTARFILIGGKTSEKTGKLPLHHSLVVGDKEHRFTMNFTDGNSFATVSHSICDYP
jgi:hypothetical protein